jgi:hypothetical protein
MIEGRYKPQLLSSGLKYHPRVHRGDTIRIR